MSTFTAASLTKENGFTTLKPELRPQAGRLRHEDQAVWQGHLPLRVHGSGYPAAHGTHLDPRRCLHVIHKHIFVRVVLTLHAIAYTSLKIVCLI
jgi:hypothetical protein